MKYDHAVKYNGVYYSAGADVPVEVIENSPKEETKQEPKKTTKK